MFGRAATERYLVLTGNRLEDADKFRNADVSPVGRKIADGERKRFGIPSAPSIVPFQTLEPAPSFEIEVDAFLETAKFAEVLGDTRRGRSVQRLAMPIYGKQRLSAQFFLRGIVRKAPGIRVDRLDQRPERQSRNPKLGNRRRGREDQIVCRAACGELRHHTFWRRL